MSPRVKIRLLWGQKVKGQGHESQKLLGRCSLVSAGFWFYLHVVKGDN